MVKCDVCQQIVPETEIYGKDEVGKIACYQCADNIPEIKEKFTEIDSCVNCSNFYTKGNGVPENEFECCCSHECWAEFNGVVSK